MWNAFSNPNTISVAETKQNLIPFFVEFYIFSESDSQQDKYWKHCESQMISAKEENRAGHGGVKGVTF